MDTPYVRQYHEDREITAWFLLDLSPSVDFGTVETTARSAAVLVDFVGHAGAPADAPRQPRRGDVLRRAASSGRSRPRGGRRQVLRLIKDLMEQPRLASAPLTDLAPLLDGGRPPDQAALAGRSSSRTSSASPAGSGRSSLLNRRHEVLAVRLWDPRETELPDVGPIIMEDAETGEQLLRGHARRGFRRRFEAAAAAARGRARRRVQARRRRGAGALDRGRPGPRRSCAWRARRKRRAAGRRRA